MRSIRDILCPHCVLVAQSGLLYPEAAVSVRPGRELPTDVGGQGAPLKTGRKVGRGGEWVAAQDDSLAPLALVLENHRNYVVERSSNRVGVDDDVHSCRKSAVTAGSSVDENFT